MYKRWMLLGLLCLTVLLAACGRNNESAPPTPGAGPSVTILSPASNTRVETGRLLEIESQATDADRITRVEMVINNELIASDTVPTEGGQQSFTVTQRWVPVAPGPVEVVVYAYNSQGQRSMAVLMLEVEGEPVAAQPPPPSPTEEGQPGDEPAPASPDAPPADAPATVAGRVNVAAGLNVRQSADINAARVGGVNFNDPVTAIARNAEGDWVKIRYGQEQEGWVYAPYVAWDDDLMALPTE
jgi:hypothetical protein